jgi:hypothetical protein
LWDCFDKKVIEIKIKSMVNIGKSEKAKLLLNKISKGYELEIGPPPFHFQNIKFD